MHTNVSIDSEMKEQAKRENLNLSELLEWAIRNKTQMIKDLPTESLRSECSKCKAIITEGYLCFDRKIVLCNDCEDKFEKKEMLNCEHVMGEHLGSREHEHRRFGGGPRIIGGKTLEQIEKNLMPGAKPVKLIEPLNSAPF